VTTCSVIRIGLETESLAPLQAPASRPDLERTHAEHYGAQRDSLVSRLGRFNRHPLAHLDGKPSPSDQLPQSTMSMSLFFNWEASGTIRRPILLDYFGLAFCTRGGSSLFARQTRTPGLMAAS
jgi:hypothetical protein